MKYESNILIFYKDIEQKPFFVHKDGMIKFKNKRPMGHSSLTWVT